MKKYSEIIEQLLHKIDTESVQSIGDAASLITKSLISGGIIQAYGGGHSHGSALEIVDRAGGLIPAKIIVDPSQGLYEKMEGAAQYITRKLRIEENDVVVIISNSGRNPFQIDLAQFVKSQGASLIVVGSEIARQTLKSRHSSGIVLGNLADVFVDNHVPLGDAAVAVEGLDTKIAPVSSIAVAYILNQMMIMTVEQMVEQGETPLVYKSGNIDGGQEYNRKLRNKYRDRIFNY